MARLATEREARTADDERTEQADRQFIDRSNVSVARRCVNELRGEVVQRVHEVRRVQRFKGVQNVQRFKRFSRSEPSNPLNPLNPLNHLNALNL
jgi:hypothetical protein